MKNKGLFITIILLLAVCLIVFGACGNGMSAYDIAVKNGFEGSEKQWLASLKGADSGKSAYELAIESGAFSGSLEQWLESLKGEKGADGVDGVNGTDAPAITIEDVYQAWLDHGNQGTFEEFIAQYLNTVTINDSTENYINKALLSAVSIYCKYTKSSWGSDSTYSSAGAGVIYKLDKTTGNAYIITNYHVVYDSKCNTANKISDDISLYLYGRHNNESAIPATYVGGSLNYDIAVLKVEKSELLKTSDARQIDYFDSNKLVVGQPAIAIGNPEALGLSVTQGILSVDSEYMEMKGADDVTDVTFRTLRIDAPVNEGNSGGGLFDAKGRLIGIVNAKISSSSVESIGYAIPSTIATYVADNIIDNCNGTTSTKVTKFLIGITVELSQSKAVYNLADQTTRIYEVVTIKEINNNSIIKNTGKVGDIIKVLKINDRTITIDRQFMLLDAMLTVRVGDTLTFTVERDGTEVQYSAIVDESLVNEIE